MVDEKELQTTIERIRQWSRAHPIWLVIFLILAAVVGVVVYWAIWADSSPTWTGFGAYDEEASSPRAKTLWDWLSLLIVPVAVAVGAAVISYVQKRTELDIAKKARAEDREIAQQARETELQIASDRQMQTTLEAYYDRMTELLLEHNLRGSEPNSEVRSIAKARTVAVVKSLDGERNRQLSLFFSRRNCLKRSSTLQNPISAGPN